MMMTRASIEVMDGAALDEVVRRLVEGGRGGRQVQLSEAEIRQLCVEAKRVLLSQPTLLRIPAPVKICGEPDILLLLLPDFVRYRARLRICGPTPRVTIVFDLVSVSMPRKGDLGHNVEDLVKVLSKEQEP